MICKIGNTSQSTIRQFQINGLIDSEGNIIHPDFHRANEEQSKKLPIPGELFRVEDGKAVFNESLGERIDNLQAIKMESPAYHGGNLLGKSEYLKPGYLGDVPFTGHFFFSDRARAEERGNRLTSARELSVVDFSKYNLLKPTTRGYWNLKETLKKVTGGLLKGMDFSEIMKKLGPEDFGSTELYFALRSKESEVMAKFSEFKDTVADDFKKVERFETTILKIAGYEGIDVRGLPSTGVLASPDTSNEGSVIFDLKEGTYVTGTPETIKSPELPTLTKPAGFKTNC